MSYPFIVQGSNITIVIDNKPYTISKTHITYEKLLDAIKAEDWAVVKDLVEPKEVVVRYGKGNVAVVNGELFWKGKPLHNAMTTRMVEMLKEGFSIDPMVAFMENLMRNPSYRSVNELYGYLEKNNQPITPDGYFLAYKRVRNDYKDCHTGTMDNSVGKVVEMERNMVDDNRDQTCSTGLHFCSLEYLKSFGGDRTMILKINPADVVSIPSDYNDSKGRCCRYEVIGEVDRNPEDKVEFSKPVQTNANSVKRSPKLGTSDFYLGYSDGFYDRGYADLNNWNQNYDEGYEKGDMDRASGRDERYRYTGHMSNKDWEDPSWPFAKA